MTTAEGTRQGTLCPEKRAPRPVNERLPTGKGREPVQHGLEGKASGVRGTREGWDVTPRPNQTNGDRRGRRGQEGAGLGNVSEISKSGNVNYTKGTVSSTVPTITVSRSLGRTGRPHLEFHPLDFILRFKDLSNPPQLPSDHI